MLRSPLMVVPSPPAAGRCRAPWLVFALIVLIPLASEPALAGEHLVSDPESPGGGGSRAVHEPGTGGGGERGAEERILSAVNTPVPGRSRLERLTTTVPPDELTFGIERALDPGVVKRFGGPGLDLEALQAAVNHDLRNGGHPHLTLVMGLAVHAGLNQLQRLPLPAVRLGPVGAGYGVATRLPQATAGFYLAPAASPGGPMARGVSMKIRGPAVPLPAGRNEASRVEFALTGEQRPDPILPGESASLRFTLPVHLSGCRVGLSGAATRIRSGEVRTHILGLGPAVAGGRFTFQGELRLVDRGGTRYLDLSLRAARPPFTVALRCYQDPDHELPPSCDIRFQVANALPRLGP